MVLPETLTPGALLWVPGVCTLGGAPVCWWCLTTKPSRGVTVGTVCMHPLLEAIFTHNGHVCRVSERG